jgi:ribosomal protein S3AE
MKLLIILLTFASLSAFANEIVITKDAQSLKVAEVAMTVYCNEMNGNFPGDDANYDCKVGTHKSNLSKKFGSIVKVQGLDSTSSDVLSNMVDDEGSYNIKLRVLFY